MAEVSLDQVRKVYPGGFEAIPGLSLRVPDGSFTVLLGPSGCGKSTLLRMIAGLETITAGACRIGERLVNEVEPADRDIAMVFQNYALYPHMTLYDNMAYGLRNRKRPEPEIAAKIAEAARILGIDHLLQRRPRELSGGQRQRVAMGRAIVRDPAVFLFDEPLSNLDAKLRVQMRLEIRRLHDRLGATSIFVTHDQVEAMTLADQVVVMNAGRIEQVGAPLAIYRRPASRFVAEFIGTPAMNIVQATVEVPGRARGPLGEALPFDQSRFAVAPGQTVDYGIRPEAIRLAEGDGATGTLSMPVDLCEELGSSRILHGRLGEQSFSVATPADVAHPGAVAWLTIDAKEATLYDRESGASLEQGVGSF